MNFIFSNPSNSIQISNRNWVQPHQACDLVNRYFYIASNSSFPVNVEHSGSLVFVALTLMITKLIIWLAMRECFSNKIEYSVQLPCWLMSISMVWKSDDNLTCKHILPQRHHQNAVMWETLSIPRDRRFAILSFHLYFLWFVKRGLPIMLRIASNSQSFYFSFLNPLSSLKHTLFKYLWVGRNEKESHRVYQ